MAYVLNNPEAFKDEMVTGFALAYSDWITQVPGGVVRATEIPSGQPVVVTGGGSGHYPAFAGLVGPGLANGAAIGNIFASPSAQQIYAVAKAAHAGGGVLLTYGNYAGDVLNFNQAQDRLRAEGIDCQTVVVTDDIASASPADIAKRRGIAGDLFVFKSAAAAAEAGKSLDEVAKIAQFANTMTRSIGVAFSGCTLPGSKEQLFTVPLGRMAVGMGIHGEPGISEIAIPSAKRLAELLVERILAEKPAETSNRAVVLLNGLGGVKYEELFVLYGEVVRFLELAGVAIVEPEVGELVTSFEMAGVSLTLSWLTPELEEFWRAPVNAPGYRKGTRPLGVRRTKPQMNVHVEDSPVISSKESQTAAEYASHLIEVVEKVVDLNADYLGKLDTVAGDGDHGIGMQRGSHGAADVARKHRGKEIGVGTLLHLAADAWADNGGGTSGALWGIMIREIANELGDTSPVTASRLSAGITRAVTAVKSFGQAEVGDKTLVDAITPFATTFTAEIASDTPLLAAFRKAAASADMAAQATADLEPKIGRARPHVQKSVGSPDPGAISFALIVHALAHNSQKG